MVVDTAQKQAPHAGKSQVARSRPNLRLRCDHFEGALEFVSERIRRLRTILTPPTSCFFDLPCGATGEADRKPIAHS